MRLQGKTAIVTGAASGIGRGISQAFAKEGAFVICADRQADESERTAETIRASGGTALSVECDVTKAADIERAVSLAESERGGLDILLNGAGIIRTQALLETTQESFQATLDVNLIGCFFMLQAVARLMVKVGRGGRIINIASIAGRQGNGTAMQYCASKAAVISLTQSAAGALIEHGINVNAIAPGFVETNMWKEIHSQFVGGPLGATAAEFDRNMIATVPAKRLGTPADIAGMAIYLAVEESSYVVGQTLHVDGGVVMI